MNKAGLVTSEKEGRSVIYQSDLMFVQDLVLFMVNNCCGEEFSKTTNSKKDNCTLIELSRCC